MSLFHTMSIAAVRSSHKKGKVGKQLRFSNTSIPCPSGSLALLSRGVFSQKKYKSILYWVKTISTIKPDTGYPANSVSCETLKAVECLPNSEGTAHYAQYTLLCSAGLPLQAGRTAEGVEAALVRSGLNQAPAQILRHQRGYSVQGSHRSVRGNAFKCTFPGASMISNGIYNLCLLVLPFKSFDSSV